MASDPSAKLAVGSEKVRGAVVQPAPVLFYRELAQRSQELLGRYRRGESAPEECPLQKVLAVDGRGRMMVGGTGDGNGGPWPARISMIPPRPAGLEERADGQEEA
jgi:hypothetical protein